MRRPVGRRGVGWHRGLRARLGLALLLTSVATLAAATLTLVPPLEHRLEADRLADLRRLALTARPALRALGPRDLEPRSAPLMALVGRLERRTGGRIVVYDEGDRPLADSAADRSEPPIAGLNGERSRAMAHRDHVVSGSSDGRAFALTVVRAGGDRLTLLLTKRLADTRAAAGVVRGALPLALVVGVGVALALALPLSRGLLRRLDRLHADARALGTEGLGHEVAVEGRDEVSDVAEALEDMRARLVEEEASRQAFVATASHELRTPLASLQATLELLREEASGTPADPARLVGRADTALRQTHRLVGLATDLLDLSRVEGDAPLRLEPLEVREMADTVAREFAARLLPEGRELVVEGGPALALADPAALARIIRILLDNASRHGAGTVSVVIEAEGDRVVVCVADEGPGLDPDEREAVFVRFARGRAAANAPGAGLGLAIARALGRAMGGDVLAVPGAPGTRFMLTLSAWQGGGDSHHGASTAS